MRIRRVLNGAWSWLGEDRRTIDILAVLLLTLIAVFCIPQTTLSLDDKVGSARWLAETSSTWGEAIRWFSALGLTRVRTSLLLRGVMAILVLLAAARADRLREIWKGASRGLRLAALLFVTGALLIAGGWAGQMAFGWSESGVTAWPGNDLVLADRNLTLPAPMSRIEIWRGGYGMYLLPAGHVIGVDVQVMDEKGSVLSLLSSDKDKPRTSLQVGLGGANREAFFLVPDAGLIFRIADAQNEAGDSVVVQAYDSASGELLVEETMSADGILPVNAVKVDVALSRLSHYKAVYNPGAAIEAAGYLALITSWLIGAIAARRERASASLVQ